MPQQEMKLPDGNTPLTQSGGQARGTHGQVTAAPWAGSLAGFS